MIADDIATLRSVIDCEVLGEEEEASLRRVLDRCEVMEKVTRAVDRDPHGATERQVDALLERNPNLKEASRALRGAAATYTPSHMAPAFRLAADRADARRLAALEAELGPLCPAHEQLAALEKWADEAAEALRDTGRCADSERAREVLARKP